MKYLLCLTAIGFIVMVQSSCTRNFKEYNSNPNGVDTSELKKDDVGVMAYLPKMQSVVVVAALNAGEPHTYQTAQNLIADMYSGYISHAVKGFQEANGTYKINQDWSDNCYSQPYNNLIPGWLTIKAANEVKSPHIYAIATVVKVAALHRISDVFGPIPYSKIGAVGLSEGAGFDSQEEVYNSFFKELDSAVIALTEFQKNNPDVKVGPKYDYVYGGDVIKWIKFANSLKLRLALRIRNVNPTLAKTMAESAVSNEFGVIISNEDNARYQTTNGNPIFNGLWLVAHGYKQTNAGAVLISLMNGYKDPRVGKYFSSHSLDSKVIGDKPNFPTYIGIRNGINIVNNDDRVTYSNINGSANEPIPWMYASETYFLRAEGALLGWNMDGTAESLYETGVQTSFDQHGVSSSAYLEDDTNTAEPYVDPIEPTGKNDVPASADYLSKITIKWNESDNADKKLERIITQKYIAMFPLSNEAWSEFRRTGYPKIWPVVVNNSNGDIDTKIQIRRLPYPQKQKLNNPNGVNEGISKLGGPDNGGTRLWWDVADKKMP